MNLKQSEYINIEIANGGFVLTYSATTSPALTRIGEAPQPDRICEVIPNQRKLINRLKELIAEKSYVPVA